MKKRKSRKKKKSGTAKGILIMTALFAVALFIYLYTAQKESSSVMSQGVYVENIDLGGKKLTESEALIREKYGQPGVSRKLQVQANNKTYVLEYSKIEARYNVDEILSEAYKYGKGRNILDNFIGKKSEERKDFKLSLTYNSKAVDELIDRIEKETNKNAENAKLSIVNGEVKITPEVKGTKLQKDKLKQTVAAHIREGISISDTVIKAPVETTSPEITAEKLSSANARISSFSTNFSTSIPNRINNIELATKAINGTLLMPGEIFSFNKAVGERTIARGYKEAGIIIGDKIESGLGGGICQVSSTLYNSMLGANIKAAERRNHSLPLAYVPKGLDATVDWGNIDFKFKNTLSKTIYIEGYTKNKNVYFNIYSDKEFAKRSYEMVTEVYETIQPEVKYIEDPNRYEGETQAVNKGSPGYKVKVYRKTMENGKVVNTELISNDYYMPVETEIARGTKKKTVR